MPFTLPKSRGASKTNAFAPRVVAADAIPVLALNLTTAMRGERARVTAGPAGVSSRARACLAGRTNAGPASVAVADRRRMAVRAQARRFSRHAAATAENSAASE